MGLVHDLAQMAPETPLPRVPAALPINRGVTDAIRAVLATGPHTCQQISDLTGFPVDSIIGCTSALRRNKSIREVDRVRPEGSRARRRVVYELTAA